MKIRNYIIKEKITKADEEDEEEITKAGVDTQDMHLLETRHLSLALMVNKTRSQLTPNTITIPEPRETAINQMVNK